MEGQQAGTLELILPLIVFAIAPAIFSGLLAKDKGRSVVWWVILSLIPIINFGAWIYFVGVSNLRIEKKLDNIMAKLDIHADEQS